MGSFIVGKALCWNHFFLFFLNEKPKWLFSKPIIIVSFLLEAQAVLLHSSL